MSKDSITTYHAGETAFFEIFYLHGGFEDSLAAFLLQKVRPLPEDPMVGEVQLESCITMLGWKEVINGLHVKGIITAHIRKTFEHDTRL